jgi:phosphoglucosamine mutase
LSTRPRLFGTDGVRGVAGEELGAELALRLGAAATAVHGGRGVRVLVLRDTRESGEMLEAAFAAGVASAGGEALLGGVLPTPAAPLLLKAHGLELAAVISASHNPYHDNGIKLFGPDGFKLPDAVEEEVEGRLAAAVGGRELGRIRPLYGCLEDYLRLLEGRFSKGPVAGRRILLDCANGATYQAGPQLFERLGAVVGRIGCEPDGRNINAGCGSTAPQALQAAVVEGGWDLGFAFDGDGDRVVAVDRRGEVVDGDELIALVATDLARRGELGGGVAVTVMSNFGLLRYLQGLGIEVAQTPVGDRNVLAELRARGWRLGGEQSGHVIDLAFNGCGDGLATALLALEALQGEELEAGRYFRRLPQVLENVPVALKGEVMTSAAVKAAIAREQELLAGSGRVVVRPSGTESVVRVMVEAEESEVAQAVVQRLVAVVREVGGPA